jgi:stage V sporulation protein G
VPIKPNNGLIAFASVVVGNGLYLGSIGVHTRLDGSGYRITYPTKKVGEKSLNIYYPINREMGKAIEKAIISRAEEVMG